MLTVVVCLKNYKLPKPILKIIAHLSDLAFTCSWELVKMYETSYIFSKSLEYGRVDFLEILFDKYNYIVQSSDFDVSTTAIDALIYVFRKKDQPNYIHYSVLKIAYDNNNKTLYRFLEKELRFIPNIDLAKHACVGGKKSLANFLSFLTHKELIYMSCKIGNLKVVNYLIATGNKYFEHGFLGACAGGNISLAITMSFYIKVTESLLQNACLVAVKKNKWLVVTFLEKYFDFECRKSELISFIGASGNTRKFKKLYKEVTAETTNEIAIKAAKKGRINILELLNKQVVDYDRLLLIGFARNDPELVKHAIKNGAGFVYYHWLVKISFQCAMAYIESFESNEPHIEEFIYHLLRHFSICYKQSELKKLKKLIKN